MAVLTEKFIVCKPWEWDGAYSLLFWQGGEDWTAREVDAKKFDSYLAATGAIVDLPDGAFYGIQKWFWKDSKNLDMKSLRDNTFA